MSGSTDGACAPKASPQSPTRWIDVRGKAFHAEKFTAGGMEVTQSPVIDFEIFVEMVGLPNIPKVNELGLQMARSEGIKNAAAMFDDGYRLIVYDPEWARTSTAEFYLVLGNEAGHHFCGHTLGDVDKSPKQRELEADRFSGASIKRFEQYHGRVFLADALKAAKSLYSLTGSRSHPPREARIEAVMLGYNSGSPCGNLAPGTRGFTRQSR